MIDFAFLFFYSNAYKKFVGSFESQIKNGRSPMDMPVHPIVPLSRAVLGSNTGPYGGLCQLDPEADHPTHDRGTFLQGTILYDVLKVLFIGPNGA